MRLIAERSTLKDPKRRSLNQRRPKHKKAEAAIGPLRIAPRRPILSGFLGLNPHVKEQNAGAALCLLKRDNGACLDVSARLSGTNQQLSDRKLACEDGQEATGRPRADWRTKLFSTTSAAALEFDSKKMECASSGRPVLALPQKIYGAFLQSADRIQMLTFP